MTEAPSPHRYFDELDARRWADAAGSKRPHRDEIFGDFVREIASGRQDLSLLELGSGPGLLADYVLRHCPIETYYLLDFSPHMHRLARERLRRNRDRVVFIEGDFRDETLFARLPHNLDVIVALQAVHEVRHARFIPKLYAAVANLLADGGLLLVCDRVNDERRSQHHLMMVEEHLQAFVRAGLRDGRPVVTRGDLTLLRAVRRSRSTSRLSP